MSPGRRRGASRRWNGAAMPDVRQRTPSKLMSYDEQARQSSRGDERRRRFVGGGSDVERAWLRGCRNHDEDVGLHLERRAKWEGSGLLLARIGERRPCGGAEV